MVMFLPFLVLIPTVPRLHTPSPPLPAVPICTNIQSHLYRYSVYFLFNSRGNLCTNVRLIDTVPFSSK